MMVCVYNLKTKDENEVFGRFKEWKTMVKKQFGKHVRSLKTENRSEFCKTSFYNF